MNFIVSANTDIGLVKETNQDSLSVKVMDTSRGRMAFAILCDGMGGLEKGEVASATVIAAFDDWIRNIFPTLLQTELEDHVIHAQWEGLVTELNQRIKAFGGRLGVRLGTTVVALLLTQERYYILNVGDSRIYQIKDGIRCLTNDQTFVAREVAMGRMTEEQAMVDERRSVLLQCVGASDEVYPELLFGDAQQDAVYLLCSDGFRHEITAEEIYEKCCPEVLLSEDDMNVNSVQLIELNKARQERDNISVALVRTF